MLYVSPLKALAVDVERNLRAPLAGIARVADARGDTFSVAGHCHPHRRHAGRRTGALSARAGRYPDHHAGVALPAPDLERTRGAALGRDHHHRRDPRARADQARRAPRALARTAGGTSARGRRSASACRPRSGRSTKSRGFWRAEKMSRDGHSSRRPPLEQQCAGPQASVRGGAVAATPDRAPADARGRGSEFAAPRGTVRYRPVTIVDAGTKKALKLRIEVPVEDMARLTTADDIPSGPASVGDRAAVDLVGDPPASARADSRAPLDADLRQQPPPRRTAGRRAERARRRSARPLAPRVDCARRSAWRSRICSKAGTPARARRHLVARARHRHGRDRSRRPDRGAAVGRERPAADRPRRPSGRRRSARA